MHFIRTLRDSLQRTPLKRPFDRPSNNNNKKTTKMKLERPRGISVGTVAATTTAMTMTTTTTTMPKSPVVVSTTMERSRSSGGVGSHEESNRHPLSQQSMSRTSLSTTPRFSTELKMSSSSSAADAADLGDMASSSLTGQARIIPQVHPDCSYLYKLPEGLHRYYQPLPVITQALALLLATWIAAATSWAKLTWWQPLSILRGLHPLPSTARFISFLAKVVTYFFVSQLVLQEITASPSRVSMQTLLQKYFLPSKLSQYQTISVPASEPNESPFSLGVHFLEYHNPNNIKNATTIPSSFDALYLQHGFGASSLSWLPVIPSLVQRMNARVGLAHDAVGFGFTDRPSHQKWYTSKQSARIAHHVLRQQCNSDSIPKAVALVGHSMGSLAMLRLATQLPKETNKFIVLSSPAFGINNRKAPPKTPYQMSWIRRKVLHPIGRTAQQTVLVPAAKYLLRRIVGTKGSWKAGLKGAWGDPAKVKDGDVLRFSWPSIGMGWEEGILRFASAQGMRQEDELDNDRTLMQRVLELPNTKVAIILGSKDRVVTPKQVRSFMNDADPDNKVSIIELDGLGHDAFEEDEERFGRVVDELLESWDY